MLNFIYLTNIGHFKGMNWKHSVDVEIRWKKYYMNIWEKTMFQLNLWSELVGIFQELSIKNNTIHLNISGYVLSFPRESLASQIIQKQLDPCCIGQKIAILRTDLPQKPLSIRFFDSKKFSRSNNRRFPVQDE